MLFVKHLSKFKFSNNCSLLLCVITIASLTVPVCPHAGGVGLCELVQHLQMFDYVALSGTKENRLVSVKFFINYLQF